MESEKVVVDRLPCHCERSDAICIVHSLSRSFSSGIVLLTMFDGGSTTFFNFEVKTSNPPEAMQLRTELLSESPYLSDTVMKSFVEKEDVLDNAMIRDVLVANPQSAKSDQIINMLENRIIPMPDYMMTQILAGEDTLSPKEILEAEKAYWEGEASKAYFRLIDSYGADTITPEDDDSLIWLFLQRNNLASYYDWASWNHSNDRYNQRDSILNLITTSFSLTPAQQATHQNYIDFVDISEEIINDTLLVFSIDSIKSLELQSLVSDNSSLPGAYARNILISSGKITYQEPIILPDTCLKSTKRDKYRGVPTLSDVSRLLVYPNPAKDYFIVEYHLESSTKEGFIFIYDMSSKRTGGYLISGKQNQMVIPVKDLMPGMYFISLFVEGKFIETKKISIIR